MAVIERMDSSCFTYEKYESNFWSRLGLAWSVRDEPLLDALLEHAVGYCNGNELAVRPRDGYAIMCEDEDFERFWFHVSEELFQKLKMKGSI